MLRRVVSLMYDLGKCRMGRYVVFSFFCFRSIYQVVQKYAVYMGLV